MHADLDALYDISIRDITNKARSSFVGQSMIDLPNSDELTTHRPPFFLRNAHLNTILANNGPRKWMVGRKAERLNAESQDVVLECSDDIRLHGEYAANAEAISGEGRGLAIFIHGWEGSAHSTYLLSAASHLYEEGFSIFRLHMRDHGPSHHLNEGAFLAVNLDEILDALEQIQKRFPHEKIYLIGFSLGGNFAVRVAANLGNRNIRLDKVLAICPAIDPKSVSHAINESPIYSRYFMRKWRKSFTRKLALFDSYQSLAHLLEHESLLSMHDEFVPLYTDYESAEAYFEAYALDANNLKNMDAPCHMLLAADDPVIRVETLQMLPDLEGLSYVVSPFGGHCGFIRDYRFTVWIDDYIEQYCR